VLSLQQSGTFYLSCVPFFRAQHGKTAHKMIDTHHAAVRPELDEGQAKTRLRDAE
jgi:hypothetical protein